LTLDNEFGTSNEDEVIIKILEGGEVQASEVLLPFSPIPPPLKLPLKKKHVWLMDGATFTECRTPGRDEHHQGGGGGALSEWVGGVYAFMRGDDGDVLGDMW
jgi:hypothetical protein